MKNTKVNKNKEKTLTISKKKLEYLEKISKEADKGKNCFGPFYNTKDLFKHLGI